MTEDMAGKIVEAYKTSPLLTGLLLLNVGIIGGFGWWEHTRTAKVEAFIYQQIQKQEQLFERIVTMAQDCRKGT
jgi:hypothetical protein